MTATSPLFHRLGYRVLSMNAGVYHLEAADCTRQFVAILHAPMPLTAETGKVVLLLCELTEGMPTDRVLDHWRNLDARRLGGQEVVAADVDLLAGTVPLLPTMLVIARPDGIRQRHAVQLASGEVVCYN